MKKIIEAIKNFFKAEKPAHAGNYAEIKKEAIEEIYKLEPVVVKEEKPKKAPAKKKPATKKKKDGSK